MSRVMAIAIATTTIAPAALANPVNIIASFDVAGFTLAPEETPADSQAWGGGDNPFENDFSGGFMSPQNAFTYADDAAEEELRRIFNPNLAYGGALWNGDNNNPGTNVPRFTGNSYAGLSGSDFDDAFINTWLLPESAWEFDRVTARFEVDTDGPTSFTSADLLANTDVLDQDFSIFESQVSTLFDETAAFSTVFTANKNAGSMVLQETAAVALNASSGTGAQDILLIGNIVPLSSDPNDPSESLFGVAFFGDENWFENALPTTPADPANPDTATLADLFANPLFDPNATSGDASNPFNPALQSAQLLVEERLWGISPNGATTPIGRREIQGSLDTLTIEQSGQSENSALLPDNITDPNATNFAFNQLPVAELVNSDGIVWIDPDIAVGYTYKAARTLDDGSVVNAVFTKAQAPSTQAVPDLDGYTLTITHLVDDTGALVELPEDQQLSIQIGPDAGVIDFATAFATTDASGNTETFTGRVGGFALTGIDEALMLDPTNGALFQTGLGFADPTGLFDITQTPIVVYVEDMTAPAPVPLPLPALLLLSGIGGLVMLRRRTVRA